MVNTNDTNSSNISQFIYCNPAMKNPKTGENVREQEIAKLNDLKNQGFSIIGLEMTVPELAELCVKNIDPQHTDGKSNESCAKNVAENADDLLKQYKGNNIIFTTNRVDLDSVAAYIIADKYLRGEEVSMDKNIEDINTHDAFQGAKWDGPKPIEAAFDPDNKTAALASSIKTFMVTPKNIEDVKSFIKTGEVNQETMNSYRNTQKNIIDKVNSGEIKTEVVGGVAYVETTLPCAQCRLFNGAGGCCNQPSNEIRPSRRTFPESQHLPA